MAAREHASCFAFTHLAPPPPSAEWMERPHLLHQLSASRIAVLCAPPGYGKTALAAQFAASQPGCAWLTLGPETPATPLLLHMLWRVWLGEELPSALCSAAEHADAAAILAHMAARLAGQTQARLLVLDAADGCDSAVRAALLHFAHSLPAHLRLLLTLRHDHDWQWHALYVSQLACRLNHHDLQWRADELDGWLQQRALCLAPATRDWLGHWPAAIAWWLHAASSAGDPSSARCALLDYCLHERIHCLPATAQQVLFHLAVVGRCPLERACSQLGEEGHTLIANLLDVALATIEGDGIRAWLQIPALIQDAVRQHLALQEPALLRRLYLLAAREACRQGRVADALRASVQAGAVELSADLLRQTGWDLLHDGHTVIVQDALLLLEGQLARLGVDGLLLHLQAQLQDGERPWPVVSPVRWEQLMQGVRLASAEWELAPTDQARFDAGLTCIRLQRALQLADLTLARELAARLKEEHLPPCLYTVALDQKGELHLLQGNPAAAAACLAEALQQARLNGHRHQTCWLAHRLAEVERARGQLQRASILREEALAFARHEGLQHSQAMEALLCGHVEICLAMQRPAEAEAALQQLLQRGEPPVLVDVLCHQCYRSQPDNSQWQASIERLWRIDPCAMPPALRVRLEQVLLDVWTASGDRERIQLWLGLLPPLTEACHAVAQFDGRNRLRAMAWLGRKQAFATLAGILQQQAAQLPADLALLRALLWEHELDDGRSDWLPALARCGLLAELRRLELHSPQRWLRVAAAGEHVQLMPQPLQLDRKDRLLLQYLEQGWSNEWIAEHMHLAMGTVKNRLTQIYRRIGVHNRAQAVHWWRFHGEQC